MNIICDLDGTIALDTKRNYFLHKRDCVRFINPEHFPCICEPKDRQWKPYFDACDTDEPCEAVIELLNGLSQQGHDTTILSGRSMVVAEKTLEWLRKHRVDYEYLQMRAVDCREDDHTLKLRWARELNLTPKNTLFVLEDRARVVAAWRSAGFRCFQVAEGNF